MAGLEDIQKLFSAMAGKGNIENQQIDPQGRVKPALDDLPFVARDDDLIIELCEQRGAQLQDMGTPLRQKDGLTVTVGKLDSPAVLMVGFTETGLLRQGDAFCHKELSKPSKHEPPSAITAMQNAG